eukprot:GFUD01013771.1.p1 GENE.GFUD01013771.1~~GFUD01013771.1.p1  ORF type:complete len:258 (-),score=83.21 GFUD01013771.1:151-867(-)
MASDKPTKEAVEQAFAKADKDENGKLTLSEFKACFEEVYSGKYGEGLGDNDAIINMMMSGFDADGDKMVSLDELLKVIGDKKIDEKLMFKTMIKGADKDGNGFLSAAEFKPILEAMMDGEDSDDEDGPPIEFFMNMADSNGDQKLSVQELLNLFTGEAEEKDPKEEMKSMFRLYDTDADGMISKKEILGFMKMMGMVDEDDTRADMRMIVNMFMAGSDEDGDGKLNYEEFCKLMDKPE